MSAICGRLGELWLQAGTATAMTKEACEVVAGTTYHVTDAAKRYFDYATAVLVYTGAGEDLQTSGYKVVGACQIQFDAAPSAPVKVSGKYLPTPAEISLVQDWSLAIENGGIFETTSLGATARSYLHCGLVSWSGAFNRFYEDDAWEARAVAGAWHLVKLYEDEPSDQVWTGYIYLGNWGKTVPVEGLQTETVSFNGIGTPAWATDEG
jgi:hypothetical protein